MPLLSSYPILHYEGTKLPEHHVVQEALGGGVKWQGAVPQWEGVCSASSWHVPRGH